MKQELQDEKKSECLWVQAVENILSCKIILDSKLFFKYIEIEHIVTYCFILWNALNYKKKKTCDVN